MDTQPYLAVDVPILLNAAMLTLTLAVTSLNKRFDDMGELRRSELHRIEEVLDARLKYLEGARG